MPRRNASRRINPYGAYRVARANMKVNGVRLNIGQLLPDDVPVRQNIARMGLLVKQGWLQPVAGGVTPSQAPQRRAAVKPAAKTGLAANVKPILPPDRRALQTLAKEFGLPAGGTNAALRARLEKHLARK